MTKEEKVWNAFWEGETSVAKIAKDCKCSKAMVRRAKARVLFITRGRMP